MENQVYLSISNALNLAHIPLSLGENRGRCGMRMPSSASTSRPSSSANPRVERINSPAMGMPIIRISRPNDSDIPVTAHVK